MGSTQHIARQKREGVNELKEDQRSTRGGGGDAYNHSLPIGTFVFVQVESVLEKITCYRTIRLHIDKELGSRQLFLSQPECVDGSTSSWS